jgi:hypothetical protein
MHENAGNGSGTEGGTSNGQFQGRGWKSCSQASHFGKKQNGFPAMFITSYFLIPHVAYSQTTLFTTFINTSPQDIKEAVSMTISKQDTEICELKTLVGQHVNEVMEVRGLLRDRCRDISELETKVRVHV